MTKRKTTSNPQPGMAAQFDSWCDVGDHPIRAGERIVFKRGKPMHVNCAPGADDE